MIITFTTLFSSIVHFALLWKLIYFAVNRYTFSLLHPSQNPRNQNTPCHTNTEFIHPATLNFAGRTMLFIVMSLLVMSAAPDLVWVIHEDNVGFLFMNLYLLDYSNCRKNLNRQGALLSFLYLRLLGFFSLTSGEFLLIVIPIGINDCVISLYF